MKLKLCAIAVVLYSAMMNTANADESTLFECGPFKGQSFYAKGGPFSVPNSTWKQDGMSGSARMIILEDNKTLDYQFKHSDESEWNSTVGEGGQVLWTNMTSALDQGPSLFLILFSDFAISTAIYTEENEFIITKAMASPKTFSKGELFTASCSTSKPN